MNKPINSRMMKTMSNLLRCFTFRGRRRFHRNQNMDSDDSINDASNALCCLSISTKHAIKYRPMPDPLSVYVPLQSLNEKTIHSIVSTVQQSTSTNWTHSQRTLLAFLVAINDRLNDIEKNEDPNKKFSEQIVQHADQVRQWLGEIDWIELREKYDQMASVPNDGMSKYFPIEKYEPYYELIVDEVG